jgi:16S rRNA (guanine966-N2)-methyltransferase
MRIISGSKRGMRLLGPGTNETRPITDRAKESLFSVLYNYDVLEEGIIADLFCGTGSMGLECLSRGAAFSTFIDMNPKVIDILHKNIEKADFSSESKVIRANIFKVGAPVDFEKPKYTLVFVDPPYKLAFDTDEKSQLGKLLFLIENQVKDDAIVVVRTSKRANLLEQYGSLHAIDHREWGSMGVTLLQKKTEAQTDDE